MAGCHLRQMSYETKNEHIFGKDQCVYLLLSLLFPLMYDLHQLSWKLKSLPKTVST